jgi:hypothetical protein
VAPTGSEPRMEHPSPMGRTACRPGHSAGVCDDGLRLGVLLFWIQPLVTKVLLPWFGRSPATWAAFSLFFQAGLVAGGLYGLGLPRLA